MKTYIFYVDQGEGCDYTIDCGKTLWQLEATNKEEALIKLKERIIGEFLPEYLDYEGGYWDESKLEKVRMFEISSQIKVPLDTWYTEAQKYKAREIKAWKETEEKKEYEKLKTKFG